MLQQIKSIIQLITIKTKETHLVDMIDIEI